jgi:lipoprotein NlpD
VVPDPARVVLGGLILAAVIGCAAPGPPPIDDRAPDYSRHKTYTVAAGDTLYSIAWRYELTVAALARSNGLRPPYTIYPGQRLRLGGSRAAQPSRAKPTSKTQPAKPAQPPPRWRWPTQAAVTKPFGNGNKGIDFRVGVGRKVVAAAAGEVVYAGNGLGGFQHLVIIQHDQRYLSAYSFNVTGRVAEGQRVMAGAVLAEMSAPGSTAQALHFEIRQDGEAINPKGVIR